MSKYKSSSKNILRNPPQEYVIYTTSYDPERIKIRYRREDGAIMFNWIEDDDSKALISFNQRALIPDLEFIEIIEAY